MNHQLTPRQKQVARLFLRGKFYPEIAEELGISAITVSLTLQRARKRLRVTGNVVKLVDALRRAA